MYRQIRRLFQAPKLAAIASAALLAVGTSLVVPSPASALEATGQLAHGTTSPVAAVSMSNLPRMNEAAPLPFEAPRPRNGLSDAEYDSLKAAATGYFSSASGPIGPAPEGSQTSRQTPIASTAFAAQKETGTIRPSDMAIAVSSTYVVQVVNSSIAVYNKTGVLQSGFPKALHTFFPGSTTDLGDPRAFYDWNANRFVVIADDFTGGKIWLAASTSASPTSWRIYSFNVWGTANCRASGVTCADYPTLGFDDSTIYLGVNLFPGSGSPVVSDYMLLLPKAKIYAGTSFGFNYWFNLSWGGILVDSIQPVTLLSPADHPRAGFALQSFNINFGGFQCRSGCNGLVVWAFSNNLQASGSPGPELSAVSVATANTYSLPASANQPGNPNSIDTGDVRISGTPIYHTGTFYGSLDTNGSDGHSHTLWFQVRPFLNDNDARCTGSFSNLCPQVTSAQLLNEDCYFCGGHGTAGSTYYGTLAPDLEGDVTMVFGFSDNNTNPESAYVSRRVTQAQNSMHDNGFVLCGGASQYLQGRWGDYTGAVADITSPTQDYLWFSAMNSISGGNWGTCIGKNGFTATNQP